jgi:ribonuclease VapC
LIVFVEPSALVAILLEEPERDEFLAKIIQAERRVISIAGKIEAALSVGRSMKDYAAAADLVSEAIERLEVEVVALTPDIFEDFVKCYARYGRGTGHGAKLNFGDCFSYAVAKRMTDGLILFKGGDFSRTDLTPA